MNKRRRKQLEQMKSYVPKMQREQLQSIAESFEDFARAMSFLPIAADGTENRQSILWKQRLMENRKVFTEQVHIMAQSVSNAVEDEIRMNLLNEKNFRAAVQALKEYHIQLCSGWKLIRKNKESYFFEWRAGKRVKASMEELTGVLSVVFSMDLKCISDGILRTDGQKHLYEFEEKPQYYMMTGFAKAVQGGGQVSGDNLSELKREDGHVFLMLSDGVGSGSDASRGSDAALELMEVMLMAENPLEQSMQLVNSTFLASVEETQMPTLDVCEVMLRQGACEFCKAGAVSSFLKQKEEVEIIPGSGTPLGMFPDQEFFVHRRTLEEDNYIIMVSDGVLESIGDGSGEEVLAEYMKQLRFENPTQIANHILQFSILQSGGNIRDDLMVYVTGIWKNEEKEEGERKERKK